MMMKLFFILSYLSMSVAAGTAYAQEFKCPTEYTDEQDAFIGHTAYIGLAKTECPNIASSIDPIASNFALIWGRFSSSEFDCPLWVETYAEYEGLAALTVLKGGLKTYCEQTMRNYGPDGRVIADVLHFTIKANE